jgi:hypothetical protein
MKIRHIILFFIFSIVVLTLQYIRGGFKPIIFHDSPYPLDSISLANEFSSVWRDIANFGYFDPTGVPLSLFYLFISPLQLLFGNILISQFVFLLIIFNVALISMYQLSKGIGLNEKFALLSSLLYVANPYSIFYVWRILNANVFLYAVAPLVILSIIKIIDNKNIKKYIFLLLISMFIAFPAFTNLAWYVSLLLNCLVISFSYSLINYGKLRIKNFLIILILLLLPFLGYFYTLYVYQSALTFQFNTETSKTFFQFNTQHINLLTIFSLTGIPPLYEKIEWFPFEYVYRLKFLAGIMGVLVGFLISILLLTKNHKSYPLIVLLLVLSIFLFQDTGYAILRNFPKILLAFRDPFHKIGWGIVLSLAVLVSLSLQEIKIKKNIISASLLGLVILLLIYWGFPVFLGYFVPLYVKNEDIRLPAFTNLPDEYSEALSYLKQDYDIKNGARVLVYPFTNILWCETDEYWGNDILRLFGISSISTLSHVNSKEEIKFLLDLQDTKTLEDPYYINFIAKLGVKYILLRKHPCESHLQTIVKDIERKVFNNSNLIKVGENDHYLLFKIRKLNSTLFSIITPSALPNESFKVFFNEIKGISSPRDLGWILGKEKELIIIKPVENAKNFTWIDMNYLNFKDYSFYDFIGITVINPRELKIWLDIRTKDWNSGPIFPYNISFTNGATKYIFKVSKLEGASPSEIDRMFINFELKFPQPILVESLEFFNVKYNLKDFLTSDSLSYKKISPTKYFVSIQNVSKPYYLIFSMAYDKGWKIYVDNKQIPEEYHFIANGFINGWYINKTGNYTLIVEYTPQRLYNISLVISGLTFASSILYLFYDWRRSKKDKWALALEKKISKIIGGIKHAKKKK